MRQLRPASVLIKTGGAWRNLLFDPVTGLPELRNVRFWEHS